MSNQESNIILLEKCPSCHVFVTKPCDCQDKQSFSIEKQLDKLEVDAVILRDELMGKIRECESKINILSSLLLEKPTLNHSDTIKEVGKMN